jgi:hypothetical protein
MSQTVATLLAAVRVCLRPINDVIIKRLKADKHKGKVNQAVVYYMTEFG